MSDEQANTPPKIIRLDNRQAYERPDGKPIEDQEVDTLSQIILEETLESICECKSEGLLVITFDKQTGQPSVRMQVPPGNSTEVGAMRFNAVLDITKTLLVEIMLYGAEFPEDLDA